MSRKSTRWAWAAAWVVLLAVFLALRLDFSAAEGSMDERIVLSVSKGLEEGTDARMSLWA